MIDVHGVWLCSVVLCNNEHFTLDGCVFFSLQTEYSCIVQTMASH